MAGHVPTRISSLGSPPSASGADPAPSAEMALSDFMALLLAAALGDAGLPRHRRWCWCMAYTLWTRPVYEASSMLRFEHEQVNLPQLVEQLTTENRISTEMEVLQGRSAAEAVIDSLGLRASLDRPRQGRVSRLFPVLRVAEAADTGTLRFRLDGDSGYAVWREGSRGRRGVRAAGRAGHGRGRHPGALPRRRSAPATSGSISAPGKTRSGASPRRSRSPAPPATPT